MTSWVSDKFKKISEEVLYPKSSPLVLTSRDIEFLKENASNNDRKRIRVCAHSQPEDTVHEMFIVHARNCYVRPHKHIDKPESLFVLEGEADVIFFEENGDIKTSFPIGGTSENDNKYYRLETDIYHMLIIKSEFLVFHEVTLGPFIPEKTLFPSWGPEEGTTEQVKFLKIMRQKLEESH